MTFSCISSPFPIMRKSDGATIQAFHDIHYFEEKVEQRIFYECTCFLFLEDKTHLGTICFSVIKDKESPLMIHFMESHVRDRYCRVGTQMVRIALKCSEAFSSGQIKVYSFGNAIGFYHKIGFKVDWKMYERREPLPPLKRQQMEKEFNQGLSEFTKNCHCFFMCYD